MSFYERTTIANLFDQLPVWERSFIPKKATKQEGNFKNGDWLVVEDPYCPNTWSIYTYTSRHFEERLWEPEQKNFKLINEDVKVIKTDEEKLELLKIMLEQTHESFTSTDPYWEKIRSGK